MGQDIRFFFVKNKKIIIISLLTASVVVILALGLGLGIELSKCREKGEVPTSTCKGKCYEPYQDGSNGCQCGALCQNNNNCCHDFEDICLKPAELWECTRIRCGEKRLKNSKCHCSDDCLEKGDCCTNYKNICHGQSKWVSGACDEIAVPSCPASFSKQPVILISLDGLRAEYLMTWSKIVPVLDKLKTCGTHSPYMQAIFPTKTFPNHYTIVTGLYAESHGLIDNSMYDPAFNASFSLSNSEKSQPRWYLGQPIWLTAMYQGLKAGTFFWPGSDVKINGTFPTIYKDFDSKVPFEERVHTIMKWLSLPENERPHFYTLYLEEPDSSGHTFGPVSGGVIESLQSVDRIIGQLMNGLKQLNLDRCVNIIVVADHGMDATSCERMEYLNNYIHNVNDLFVYEGAFSRIRQKDLQKPFDPELLVGNLTCKNTTQKFKPFLKENLPKRYHYANSRRIEDVNLVIDAQWLLSRKIGSYTFCNGGNHGYDNDHFSMQAMFLAYGPKFFFKSKIEPFSNVQLYNVLCDLLEIHPAPNNGTHGSMNHMLRKPFYNPNLPQEMSQPEKCPLKFLNPSDNLTCSCNSTDVEEYNKRLNLTTNDVEIAEKTHMPLGRPIMLQENEQYCLLHHQGFVSAYSRMKLIPIWTSFTLNKPANADPLPEMIKDCLRADVRIPPEDSAKCESYTRDIQITESFLYPPNLAESSSEQYDGLLISNVVPMYPAFKKIWMNFHNIILKKYALYYGLINVISGPAFDYNYNGRSDSVNEIIKHVNGTQIPIPTHYFIIIASCKNGVQNLLECDAGLQTISFILPHRPENQDICRSGQDEIKWTEDFMWLHQSTVTDVEWLTGLDFFHNSNLKVAELLRIKSFPTAAITRLL
ncbi:ectonucleotide pyrophosphatase/phosphodiesterase family member 3-like [Erpetoichthys calabaricus]|uniref:ectonucleotide pyrophosphatase/phosphodiesterase family member 3-like n=1 Tax=Erpetoichthys calabaricus TaxID=27687 RepID=UPI0022347FD6|nr:ectonucleotide pyrophosphatase/phosphodiesterase family member 3-like [Erpetoichthys calabaricus]